MVIGDIVICNARLFPDKPGVVDGHNRLTWKEVNWTISRTGSG